MVEDKGVFYCHRGGHGGGKADLVVQVLGCSRKEAIQFIAELAGLNYGMTRDQWIAWKKNQEKIQKVREWTARLVAVFRDLAGSYRTVEPLNVVRADRYDRIADGLESEWSGEELVRWYDQRRHLRKATSDDAWSRLEAIRQEKQASAKQLIEASRTEWLLLGACATPKEWEASLVEYQVRCGESQKRRDPRSSRGGGSTRKHDQQSAT